MKRNLILFSSLALILAVSASFPSTATACTGITIHSKDGATVRARTLEFATPLDSNLVVIPRGFAFEGADGDKVGLHWKGRYGLVGTDVLGLPIIADGLNEKGLSAGLFYHPTCAEYPASSPSDHGNVLAPWDVATYVLSNCATVDEALATLKHIPVKAVVFKAWKIVPPVHYVISDAAGHCAVVEFTHGEMKTFDNPLGVITNAPTFDWHITNLRTYLGLSPFNEAPEKPAGVELLPLGQGSGMRGLPGDFTPPSRFVRAVAFAQTAQTVENAEEGMETAFRILNLFDIPKGVVRGKEGAEAQSDHTQWTSAADMTRRRFYIRTYSDSQIRMIDLSRCNLDAKAIATIKLEAKEPIEDLTPAAK